MLVNPSKIKLDLIMSLKRKKKESLEHHEILYKCCLLELASLGIVLLEHFCLPQGIGVEKNLR